MLHLLQRLGRTRACPPLAILAKGSDCFGRKPEKADEMEANGRLNAELSVVSTNSKHAVPSASSDIIDSAQTRYYERAALNSMPAHSNVTDKSLHEEGYLERTQSRLETPL